MYKGYKIIDGHIHYALPIAYEEVEKAMALTGADRGVLVNVPDRQRVLTTPESLMIKAHDEGKYYVFTSFDVSEYFKSAKNVGRALKKFVANMLKMGCDGVKIIEGKPNMRKMLPVGGFDTPTWEEFWAYAEQEGVNILWHVNDPQEFWDKDAIPSFASEKGWFYDESFVHYEQQYAEVENILRRHPNIKITFAHFFFMSKQLDRLQAIFDAYPNVAVDITPGIELFINLSEDADRAREFFIKNRKRILYGTDVGARAVLGFGSKLNFEEGQRRSEIIGQFLTGSEEVAVKADGNFLIGAEDFTLRPLNLPKEVCEDIFYNNFIDRVGEPRKLNKKLIIKECKRIKLTIKIMSFIDKSIKPDYSYANSVIKYFKENK